MVVLAAVILLVLAVIGACTVKRRLNVQQVKDVVPVTEKESVDEIVVPQHR